MEGQVKFFNPQNTARVSQEKSVVAITQTMKVTGDLDSNLKKYIVKPQLLLRSNPSILKPQHAKLF